MGPEPPFRIPVRVIDALTPDTLRVLVGPGMGMVDGGSEQTWPIDRVPPDLRAPNTEFWMVRDPQSRKSRVER